MRARARFLSASVLTTASLLATATWLLACSPDEPLASAANAGASGAGGRADLPTKVDGGAAGAGGAGFDAGAAGASGGAGAGGQACADAPGAPGGPTTCVREVRGRLVDEAGEGIAARTVTLCGVVCFAGLTDPQGSFAVPVNARLWNGGYVIQAHGRPDRATTYVRLPEMLAEIVTLERPVTMPLLPPSGVFLPADGDPEATLVAGVLTLRVPAATTWELDVEDFDLDGAPRPFAYARVTGASVPAFAVGAPLVFALGPFAARPDRPVPLEIADTGGLPPGSAVELSTMDDGVYFAENTGGLPRVMARGHVSADGTHIRTDEGEGLDVLGWLAVRQAP